MSEKRNKFFWYKGDLIENKTEDKKAKKTVAKTFNEILEILKFNPNHDELGRFASAPGSGSVPDKKALTGETSLKLKRRQEEEDYTYDGLDIMDGETIVGEAGVMHSEGDNAYLERIDIDEKYRNKKYGTKAIRQIVDTYGSIYVSPDNERAKRLYERLGDEVDGDKADMYDQGYGVFEIS